MSHVCADCKQPLEPDTRTCPCGSDLRNVSTSDRGIAYESVNLVLSSEAGVVEREIASAATPLGTGRMDHDRTAGGTVSVSGSRTVRVNKTTEEDHSARKVLEGLSTSAGAYELLEPREAREVHGLPCDPPDAWGIDRSAVDRDPNRLVYVEVRALDRGLRADLGRSGSFDEKDYQRFQEEIDTAVHEKDVDLPVGCRLHLALTWTGPVTLGFIERLTVPPSQFEGVWVCPWNGRAHLLAQR